MATNILSVPFKRTRAVPLLEKLTAFISTALDQHPEQFKDDLAALDRLRADVVVMDVHSGCLERLVAYHAQLLALAAKLPVDVCPLKMGAWLMAGWGGLRLVSQSESGCAHPK